MAQIKIAGGCSLRGNCTSNPARPLRSEIEAQTESEECEKQKQRARSLAGVTAAKTVVATPKHRAIAKHQAALSVAYGSGLRVAEVAMLKVRDVDSEHMLLSVERGKGGQYRNVMLSADLLALLRQGWKVGHEQGVMHRDGRLFWMTMLGRALPNEKPECALTAAEIGVIDQLAARAGIDPLPALGSLTASSGARTQSLTARRLLLAGVRQLPQNFPLSDIVTSSASKETRRGRPIYHLLQNKARFKACNTRQVCKLFPV